MGGGVAYEDVNDNKDWRFLFFIVFLYNYNFIIICSLFYELANSRERGGHF